jgi:hypothetical protein
MKGEFTVNSKSGKTLRVIAVVFLGLTATMNLLGGAGTVCAAFLTKQYPPMWSLYEYRWLYQILMITTIAIGVAGIWALMGLVRRKEYSYRNALILLIIGTVLGGIHVGASLILRGKAVPANMKLYINILTLILFLIMRLPGIWEKINFSGPGDKGEGSLSGGLAAIISGVVTLTTFIWAGPSHTYQGVNWVELFDILILGFGLLMLLGGIGLIAHWLVFVIRSQHTSRIQSPTS